MRFVELEIRVSENVESLLASIHYAKSLSLQFYYCGYKYETPSNCYIRNKLIRISIIIHVPFEAASAFATYDFVSSYLTLVVVAVAVDAAAMARAFESLFFVGSVWTIAP